MPAKKGDVVVALGAITDVNQYDEPYIHALPGMRGVVVQVEDPEFPVVAWEPEGHGLCNVPIRLIAKMPGEVWQAVDFKEDN